MSEDRPQIIAVDFDGTIVEHNFPDIGDVKPSVVSFLTKKSREGAEIILWTTRQNERLREAREFIKERNIPIDYFNENASCVSFNTSNRIYADVYIGDRMVNVNALNLLSEPLDLVGDPIEEQ